MCCYLQILANLSFQHTDQEMIKNYHQLTLVFVFVCKIK